MGTLVRTCPHCKAGKVTFTVLHNVVHPTEPNRSHALAICGNCFSPIALRFQRLAKGFASPTEFPGDLAGAGHLALKAVWPDEQEDAVPADTPERAANAYREASDSLRREKWNSAGMMFRRTLELATRHLDAALAGKNLKSRIDALADKQLVTPAMKDWAHIIRLDGNDAAHEDEEIDEKTAKGLKDFTEVFLLYAFTLPSMVKQKRHPPIQQDAAQKSDSAGR